MAHTPVLVEEVMRFLDPRSGEVFLDGTAGGGGHAARILKRIEPNGRLALFDWDKESLERLKSSLRSETSEPLFFHGNFSDAATVLRERGFPPLDGVLLDLGFSSDELERSGRGFSFRRDEPLLMTYDVNRRPVKDLIRMMDERDLATAIFKFGEERFSRRIARSIKEQEKIRPVATTAELHTLIARSVPKNYERGRINPATRTFQALRIYANDELGNLERVLSSLPRIMNRGGRVAVISFHSLEDAIVKKYMNQFAAKNSFTMFTRKPVRPSAEEVRANPRSRSARLRAGMFA